MENKYKYAQVLVEIAKLGTRTFSYSIPDELSKFIKIGVPVLVPFGSQGLVNAYVVGFTNYMPDNIKAKPIYEILDENPIFDMEYLKFLEWVSTYYCTSLTKTLESAIPTKFFARSKRIAKITGEYDYEKLNKTQQSIITVLEKNPNTSISNLQKKSKLPPSRYYTAIRKLRDDGVIEINNLIEEQNQKTQFEKIVKLKSDDTDNKRYKDILEDLKNYPEGVERKEFSVVAKTTYPTLNKLETIGLIEIEEKEVYRNPLKIFEGKHRDVFPKLTDFQENAYEKIEKAIDKKQQTPVLLYGVTGSGKTEVYFKAIKKVIEEGKNVMFLAPEIPIASQLAGRLVKRFGLEDVAIWHSNISEGEKFDVWQRLRQDKVKILAGARSAVFAPLKNIGLIIIDEEHEASYKQTSQNPRYNAKTLAVEIAKRSEAVTVMGSATPDITSYWRAINSSNLIKMSERFGKNSLAKTIVVDMKREQPNGNYSIFSRHLKKEIEANLANKKQTILLMNRRGFSTTTQCQGCGYIAECKNCAIPLVYHRQSDSLKCHYCDYERAQFEKCPECNSETIKSFGIGTQRVEEVAKQEFPDARIERIDGDIMTKKNAHIEMIERFEKGEIDILIGTQMIAKGLDNHNVTLVGVMSCDVAFSLPDYRGAERGFQLLTQVAGRAGRGDYKGKVLFQTYAPEFFALESAKEQSFEKFYSQEIESRLTFSYPPYSQIIRLVLSSKNQYRVEKIASEIAMRLKDITDNKGISEKLEVLGPVNCIIAKIKDEYRFHIIIKNRLEEKGHFLVSSFIDKIKIPEDIKLIVDVDPTEML